MTKVHQNYDPQQSLPPPPYTNSEGASNTKEIPTPSAPIFQEDTLTNNRSYEYNSLSAMPSHHYGEPENTEIDINSLNLQTNFYPPQKATVQVDLLLNAHTYNETLQDRTSAGHPLCFRRPPQIQINAPGPFPAFQVPCKSRDLQEGFPLQYPVPQHMFTHDVHEADWACFIRDISDEGRLNGAQKVTAAVLPLTMRIGAPGFLISRAIEKKLKRGSIDKIAAKIDIWNYCFFNPREINITLYQGQRSLSGTSSTYDNSSSSSSASSSEEEPINTDGCTRRQLRRARRAKRKELRRQKKQLRKQEKRAYHPFYLLVESL